MNTFTFGSYFGKTHEEVCAVDPHYVIFVYENSMDNGGINRDVYRKAVIAVHGKDEDETDIDLAGLDFDEEAGILVESLGEDSEDLFDDLGC